MVPGITLIAFVFIVQAVGQSLMWLYWLQVKEYRSDRFLVFLKSSDGIRELLLIPEGFKFLMLFLGIFNNALYFVYLVEISFLALFYGILFLKNKLRKPVFTQRIFRILMIQGFLIFSSIIAFNADFWLLLTLGETVLVAGLFLGIFATGLSVRKTKELEKKMAKDNLEEFLPTIVAISGSYGKTTTKDFITQILSTKYKVLSTYKNQNTHFGIIRRINSDLKKDHDFFVAEIGAYKRGEIEEISEVLKPKVAVITGIEPQHLELFGSLENIKRAKFELIESLGKDGLAFFNMSSTQTEALIIMTRKLNPKIKIFTYAVGKKGNFDAKAFIKKVDSTGIVFGITVEDETREIETNIYSQSLIENLCGAILLARKFGIDWARIEKVCKNLVLPEGTLNIFKTKKGMTVIDDSYNATPKGFEAGLKLLGEFKGDKKIVLTTGIIELGKETFPVHEKLGKKMNGIVDAILLRNKEFINALESGLSDKNKLIFQSDQKKMIDFVEKLADEKSVILIEGKLPQVVNYYKNI